MSSQYTSLVDLGDVAVSHRDEIEEVKRQIGITHGYFDAWMYGFLENKKFNIEETVAKLHRRFAMEVSELATYEITDYMRDSLRKGIIQDVGVDKAGRVAFYIYTKRDTPQSKYRSQQRQTFDMFVSYGTRLRKENMRCQMVMLINQDGASVFRNVDMSFQADVALRISKFYPGGVDKMYICNMGSTLAAFAKPIFRTLPPIVSDRIQIIDSSDMKNNVLLDLVDASVLPVALGGKNECDTEGRHQAYAKRIEAYYNELKVAVNERGLTVKEWELEKLGINPNNPTDAAHAMMRLQSNRSFSNNAPRTACDELSAAVSCYDDFKSVRTCASEDLFSDHVDDGDYEEEGTPWREIMAPFPTGFALFFLDELLRWRTSVEELEFVERYQIMDQSLNPLSLGPLPTGCQWFTGGTGRITRQW